MPQFFVTPKKKPTDPEQERWQEIVEEVDGIEVLRYMANKMLVDHHDEVQLHVAVSSVCDIQRV